MGEVATESWKAPIDGLIQINGVVIAEKVSLYITKELFFITNLSLGHQRGPRISIKCPWAEIGRTEMLEGKTRGVAWHDVGVVGSINRFIGYDEADVGAFSRDIEEVRLSIEEIDGSMIFSFEGQTGELKLNSVADYCRRQVSAKDKEKQHLVVRFSVPTAQLDQYIGSAMASAALKFVGSPR